MKAVDVTQNVAINSMNSFNRIILEGKELFDLVYSEQAGFLAFASTGIDPQMVLHRVGEEGKLELKAGLHRFLFQARVSKGRISRPRLYLDYGSGFSEATNSNIFLTRIAEDTWLAEFTTPKPVVRVRFDPSESPVRYTLVRMEIEEERGRNFRLSDSVYLGGKAFYRALPLRIQNSGILKSAAAALSLIFKTARQRELERITHSIIALPSNAKGARQAPVAALDPTPIHRAVYDEAVATAHGARDPSYAPLRPTPTLVAPDDPLLLAFYLPQFHPFHENNEWWGQGFTEWTNVSKAVPQFAGHYQPRLPGELGFYDLRLPEVMKRQFELARHFGISGFCFHYYWFAGKRLLEKPIEALLTDKSPQMDFPFCLCWANENWTRRWDGAEQDVLMQQSHTREDHKAVFHDLLRYMVDDRYIRIDGKPVIMVYRPAIIPNIDEMVKIWREEAQFAGLPGIYLIASTAFSFDDAESIGFDAIAQFPPHAVSVGEINDEVSLLNEDFDGAIYDYGETVDAYKEGLALRSRGSMNTAYHPGVMTAWDNEARKPGRGHIFHKATPAKFFDWLQFAMSWAESTNPPNERIVFINAWNEWAEGTYLEPDRKLGYAYLTAVGSAREERVKPSSVSLTISKAAQRERSKDVDTVVLLHLYYTDLASEIAAQIEDLRQSIPCDIIVTVPDKTDPETLKRVIDTIRPTRVLLCKNRGRDIWPFIEAARLALNMGYEFACKLHSKKSPHLSGGERWRRGLLGALTNKDNAFAAIEQFKRSKHIGIVAPSGALALTTKSDTMRDNQVNVDKLLSRFASGRLHEQFVAGTMFWLRLKAVETILTSDIGEGDFGPELGAIDGTFAHAFERVFPSIVISAGFEIASFESDSSASPYSD